MGRRQASSLAGEDAAYVDAGVLGGFKVGAAKRGESDRSFGGAEQAEELEALSMHDLGSSVERAPFVACLAARKVTVDHAADHDDLRAHPGALIEGGHRHSVARAGCVGELRTHLRREGGGVDGPGSCEQRALRPPGLPAATARHLVDESGSGQPSTGVQQVPACANAFCEALAGQTLSFVAPRLPFTRDPGGVELLERRAPVCGGRAAHLLPKRRC